MRRSGRSDGQVSSSVGAPPPATNASSSQPTVFARGFTNIIDVAFDRRGRVYVLEISKDGLLNVPRTSSRWAR